MADTQQLAIEYERLFRNVMEIISGNMDFDGVMVDVGCDALFAHKPELRQLFEDSLSKADPKFAANLKKWLKQ
jgi:hypothetical protein